jgi:glycosyltransferase involved in cell wall biosynthesis
MTTPRRILFCLPTTALSGGVKVIFEIANRLVDAGNSVELFSYAGQPKWTSPKATIIAAKNIAEVDFTRYDFVFASNAFFLPLLLPNVAPARLVFFCQDWESFHHSRGTTYTEFVSDDPTFVALYQLPVPIIATSRAICSLIRSRAGRDAYFMQVGLNKTIFAVQPRKAPTPRKRVLLVGNYLMPYKGMRDGLEALRILSNEIPLELVLVTQEYRDREVLDACGCPVDLRFCPTEHEMPAIYASCDAYCCTSWYEGLGLPALEAFRCGVPVVSTRTFGVSDYGVDETNLLLAAPNDPADLAAKLRRVLTDESLADRLRAAAFATVDLEYDWNRSYEMFAAALDDIDRTYAGPGSIDAAAMAALSARLEAEGNFTPIETFREFYRLSGIAGNSYRQMSAARYALPECVATLRDVRMAMTPYVANPLAEYFRAFKAEFDRCQLVLSLTDDDRFPDYLDALLAHGRTRTNGHAPSRLEPERSLG